MAVGNEVLTPTFAMGFVAFVLVATIVACKLCDLIDYFWRKVRRTQRRR